MTARQIPPGPRQGRVRAPSSKSQAHRLLICAALGQQEVEVACEGLSQDILATAGCLRALGAGVDVTSRGLAVRPGPLAGGTLSLPCGESGSTLRFLLPLAGVLGAEGWFEMAGRLPQRPLAPLDEQLRLHGMTLVREGQRLYFTGQLQGGTYTLPGNVSSQYLSGLLMALPHGEQDSRLLVEGTLESAPYVAMTEQALSLAGIRLEKGEGMWHIPGGQRYALPRCCQVEGDWSNGAFFLCMGALSPEGVRVEGLSSSSCQGDRQVLAYLRDFGAVVEEEEDALTVRRGALRGITIDAAPIPDLIPTLCVLAAAGEGETQVLHAGRLRLKESDRLRSTAELLRDLGGDVEELPEGLVIRGRGGLRGGRAEAQNDHRIAMAASVAACACQEAVEISQPACVEKSYPRFWQDFESLKGGRT